MTLRKFGRIAVEFPASLSALTFRGSGIILEVKKDDYVGLLIDLPGYDKPLYVNQAAIKWTSNEQFGLEFIQMELNDRQRLQEIVQKLSPPT